MFPPVCRFQLDSYSELIHFLTGTSLFLRTCSKLIPIHLLAALRLPVLFLIQFLLDFDREYQPFPASCCLHFFLVSYSKSMRIFSLSYKNERKVDLKPVSRIWLRWLARIHVPKAPCSILHTSNSFSLCHRALQKQTNQWQSSAELCPPDQSPRIQ